MLIKINKQLDKEVYLAFYDGVVGGTDFGKIIKDTHPTITKENYSEYIDNYYAENAEELQSILIETQQCFADIKDALFSQLQKYFEFDFINEDYTCNLSIFNCNPRYIETKTFQVFYRRRYDLRKEVIAHELTHFAFYDFCFSLGIKDSGELWELSEIFNVIILNLEPLRSAIGDEELLFYPDLKEKLNAIRLIWDEETGIKEFILHSLEVLKGSHDK